MARVQVTHEKFDDDSSREPPLREALPEGKYHVIIMRVESGATNDTPPLARITVEFQVLSRITENGDIDEGPAGRRLYQHFVLERDLNRPSLSDTRRFELRMLLDATDTPFEDGGFDTDYLIEKTVIVQTRNRDGKTKDQWGRTPVFSNVVRIDGDEPVEEGDLV